MLTTTLKKKAANKSGLILPDQYELSDVQRVIRVGPYVKTYDDTPEAVVYLDGTNKPAEVQPKKKVSFGEGDWVKINMHRFVRPKSVKSLKDGSEFDETKLDYFIPVVTFNGEDYLEVDQGDVEYWWDGKSA
jgi:hypothetical protein